MSVPQPQPQPGDILLFYNAAGMARFITFLTQSPYYHVALYEGDHRVIEARLPGVVRRDLRSIVGGSDYVVIPAPQGKGEAALQWARQQVGRDYALLQVVFNIGDRLLFRLGLSLTHNRNRYTCTELVDCAYLQAGVDLLPQRRSVGLTPRDFARLLDGNAE